MRAAQNTSIDYFYESDVGLRVIVQFDELMRSQPSIEELVLCAAIVSRSVAGFHDNQRGLIIRRHPDGRTFRELPSDEQYRRCARAVGDRRGVTVWIEHASSQPSLVESMTLERFAAIADLLLNAGWSTASMRTSLVRTLLDEQCPESVRVDAASELGLSRLSKVRVIAASQMQVRELNRGSHFQSTTAASWQAKVGSTFAIIVPENSWAAPDVENARSGTSAVVTIANIPRAWRVASGLLRLTSNDARGYGGAKHILEDDFGAASILPMLVTSNVTDIADVAAIDEACAELPWVAETLCAVADSTSVRHAATSLYVHHSTLVSRLKQLESALGYSITTPQGKFRLQFALLLRRLTRETSD
ncbi:helix-turn-helix domain-containing protein [Subtercola sp. YIM 133946]